MDLYVFSVIVRFAKQFKCLFHVVKYSTILTKILAQAVP